MKEREEWFRYFEDVYQNEYLYIYNIGYYDYRIRKATEGKEERLQNSPTLHFVVGGRGTLTVDGKMYSISAGDVFTMPVGVPMSFYPDENNPWRYYWFLLNGNGVADVLRQMGLSSTHPVIHSDRMPEIKKRLDELLDSDFNYGEFYYRALATLYHLISFFVKESSVDEEHVNSLSVVGQAKEIILKNYQREDFSVSEIHKHVHVSEPYLRKVFKQATGVTLSAFLINCRLSRAADLLRNRDYSIRELCYMTGYSDEVYFVRQFKKKYGVPPKKYRRMILLKQM